jgi:putative membrane protein
VGFIYGPFPKPFLMDRRSARTLGLAIFGLVVAIFIIFIVALALHFAEGAAPVPRYFPFWILGAILIVFIVMFIVRVILWGVFGYPPYRYYRRYWRYGPVEGQRSAEQIVDERYARGEITREQYQQMKGDMRRGGT